MGASVYRQSPGVSVQDVRRAGDLKSEILPSKFLTGEEQTSSLASASFSANNRCQVKPSR